MTTPVTTSQEYAVQLDSVAKTYGTGDGAVTALRGVTLRLRRGRFTAVMGPSGSGKSTFLHCAAGLDRPTSGTVRLGDVDLGRLKETALTELRRSRIGFIFQAYNLVPSLSALDNITLPLRFGGQQADRAWLHEVIGRVGLAQHLDRKPSQLSGGQQQRVAIARALITRPEVVFADEPTGALDTRTGAQVLTLLRDLVESIGQTVVMVTHDPVAASHAHSVIFLADGRVVDEVARPTPDLVATRMTTLGDW
ncbi:putative ABC transport system ATP-binding protein [Kibdelosporangium banguiense]|uniref:ABC transport system ATP-binding protein n=1 Tax=Kibdelosporangium banguiense TaxID=1365924 RepID=A0ABS4TTH4_9PSEU|nr:ABC transporter ATP-binding protein [Kibdelosporangium banguiense]MBP2327709.1 putative ABC transport system ATP-binding protein [Kibdelosporangium banguiense]